MNLQITKNNGIVAIEDISDLFYDEDIGNFLVEKNEFVYHISHALHEALDEIITDGLKWRKTPQQKIHGTLNDVPYFPFSQNAFISPFAIPLMLKYNLKNEDILDYGILNIRIPHVNRIIYSQNATLRPVLEKPLSRFNDDTLVFAAFAYYVTFLNVWSRDKLGIDDSNMLRVAAEYIITFACQRIIVDACKQSQMSILPLDTDPYNIEQIINAGFWKPIQIAGHMSHAYPNDIDISDIIDDFDFDGEYRREYNYGR